jgi:hypothetical protein
MTNAMTTPAGRNVAVLLRHDGLELWRVLPDGNFYVVEISDRYQTGTLVQRMTRNLMMGEASAILRTSSRISDYREELA